MPASPNEKVVAARRQRLREWIDTRYDGTDAKFIADTKINQGELSGLLRSKSFGEKRAATLEAQAKMPPGYLVNPLATPMAAPAQSQPAQLDLARLGLALTAIDKALAHMELQGRLGLLAESLQFAYARAFKVSDPESAEQRELFDDLVAERLGGVFDERGRVVEASAGENRKASPTRKKAGNR